MTDDPGRRPCAELLFSAEDVPEIRARTRLPLFRSWWESLLAADLDEARAPLAEPVGPTGYSGPMSHGRAVLRNQSLLYLMTGDRRHGDLARLAVDRALEYPMWATAIDRDDRPVGIQTGPGTLIGMCLAYDWLGDLLSDADREAMRRQIGDKGCEACDRSLTAMSAPDADWGWRGIPGCGDNTEDLDISRWPAILAGTNLQVVPMTALAFGAVLLDGIDDRADRWFEMVRRTYEAFAASFEPDGSYSESASYWAYTARHLALTADLLNRGRGVDLFDRYNYVGMIEFSLALHLACTDRPHGAVNFGDAHNTGSSAVAFWVARRSRDGLAQYVALNHTSGHDIESLIWYDPAVKPVAPTPREHFRHLDLDWIIARTGYTADDLVVAMRCGKPGNHEHADRNAILLKAYGEVLLADIRKAPYPKADPAWMLRTSPAHNTVLIDGRGHQYHDGREGTNASRASARIVRRGDRGDHLFWAGDATPAYALVNDGVEAVTRTVILAPRFPCLIVLDKLVMRDAPARLSARWHIENRDGRGAGRVDGAGFTIERPGARLTAVCGGSGPVRVEQATLPVPEESGVFPYVEAGPADAAREHLLILAGCPHRADEPAPEIAVEPDEQGWRVTVRKDGTDLTVAVTDTGRLPTFEVTVAHVEN